MFWSLLRHHEGYVSCFCRNSFTIKKVVSVETCGCVFISVINQLGVQNFYFAISLFHASTCFEHICSSSGGKKLHYTASGIITLCRCGDTRGCVMQFWPPDDGHMCSKHVEAWNKLIVKQKFCTSSWLITEIIILRCTVSKTSENIWLCVVEIHFPLTIKSFALDCCFVLKQLLFT